MASAGTLPVGLCPCWVDVGEAGALAATESYMVAVGESGALGAGGGMETRQQAVASRFLLFTLASTYDIS